MLIIHSSENKRIIWFKKDGRNVEGYVIIVNEIKEFPLWLLLFCFTNECLYQLVKYNLHDAYIPGNHLT